MWVGFAMTCRGSDTLELSSRLPSHLNGRLDFFWNVESMLDSNVFVKKALFQPARGLEIESSFTANTQIARVSNLLFSFHAVFPSE